MKYDYDKIVSELNDIDSDDILLHQEDESIYFLSQSLKNGSLIIEECNNSIIVWSNELKFINSKDLYKLLMDNIDVPIYIVYIETKEERDTVIELGGKPIEFYREDCEDCGKFGSYILRKNK